MGFGVAQARALAAQGLMLAAAPVERRLWAPV
jgi:hypothetical protein